MKPCEICGKATANAANGVPYCAEHFRDGLIQQARLTAWAKGASRESIERLATWTGEQFDQAGVTL